MEDGCQSAVSLEVQSQVLAGPPLQVAVHVHVVHAGPHVLEQGLVGHVQRVLLEPVSNPGQRAVIFLKVILVSLACTLAGCVLFC